MAWRSRSHGRQPRLPVSRQVGAREMGLRSQRQIAGDDGIEELRWDGGEESHCEVDCEVLREGVVMFCEAMVCCLRCKVAGWADVCQAEAECECG